MMHLKELGLCILKGIVSSHLQLTRTILSFPKWTVARATPPLGHRPVGCQMLVFLPWRRWSHPFLVRFRTTLA